MVKAAKRKPNAKRSADMRAALIAAARRHFVKRGYVDAATPDIVRDARVTRGALYHHFKGKADLFRAVVEAEAGAVAAAIDQSSADSGDPVDLLVAGADAYFEAMEDPGRVRLLLVDGPAVLGSDAMQQIYAANDRAQLQLGLVAAMEEGGLVPIAALADVVSASFDRAVLAMREGGKPADYRKAVEFLLRTLVSSST